MLLIEKRFSLPLVCLGRRSSIVGQMREKNFFERSEKCVFTQKRRKREAEDTNA